MAFVYFYTMDVYEFPALLLFLDEFDFPVKLCMVSLALLLNQSSLEMLNEYLIQSVFLYLYSYLFYT